MPAFAAMLTQLMQQSPGGGTRQVVDRTGLAGNFDAAIDFSQQANMGGGDNNPPGTYDPGGDGASSIFDSVQKMGLRLDAQKAPVEQVVVAHVEKMPTEN